MRASDSELRELEAEALNARQRAARYRDQAATRGRPIRDARMRQLEHFEQWAAERLERAREQRA
jgi:hypothetical protein